MTTLTPTVGIQDERNRRHRDELRGVGEHTSDAHQIDLLRAAIRDYRLAKRGADRAATVRALARLREVMGIHAL